MNKYKILWIDDQYELLSELMERCEVVNGFEITKCRFAKEGMIKFESHLEEWSAVVLDAKVLMESLNEVPNLRGLRYCRDRINELKPRRYVPMFVFTGQPDLISNELFENMVDKFYSKGDDDDQLIEDIISAADQQENTQIIHKHQTVFDAWPESKHDLLRILKVLEREDWPNNSIFTDIRKVLTDVMVRFYDSGFCTVKPTASNLAACSKMLGQRYMEELIPIYVQSTMRTCVEITNPGSHRTETDAHVKDNKAPYLLRSLIYCLLDVLFWADRLKKIDNRDKVLQAVKVAQEKFEIEFLEREHRKKI